MTIKFCGNPSTFSQFPTVTPQEILAYFEDKEIIALDTETKGRDCHTKPIITLQLGDHHVQFVIDCRVVPISLFKDVVERSTCIIHNVGFDYKFLKKAGITLNKVWDTFLAEAVIFNGFDDRGLSLLACAKNYLNVDLDKTTRGEIYKVEDEPLTDKQIEYAGLDVRYLHEIRYKQRKSAEYFDLITAIELENKAVLPLSDMEYYGVYLDSQDWIRNTGKYEQKVSTLISQLDESLLNDSKNLFRPLGILDLFGHTHRQLSFNYGSPLQVGNIARTLGYPMPDTSDRELQIRKNKHLFFNLMVEYRTSNKIVSSYGMKFLNHINSSTKRVHTSFWQVRDTFRVSSDDPNLQNIPGDNSFRNCFKPRKGFKWVSIDYSGQEMRIMADFSQEQGFLKPIKEGLDIHCYVASEVFGKTVTKEDKVERTKIKNINFMKPYGGGPPKLSYMLGIPLSEAEEIFRLYDSKFYVLDKWLKASSEFGLKNGYILTNSVHKGRRWFPKLNDRESPDYFKYKSSVQRKSMNTPIQGTGAVMIKEAMVACRDYLIEKGYYETDVYMILTVHDEINFEIRENLAETICKDLCEIMIDVGKKYVTSIPMSVDPTITDYWNK